MLVFEPYVTNFKQTLTHDHSEGASAHTPKGISYQQL